MPQHAQKPGHLCLGFRTRLNVLLHVPLLGWGHCWGWIAICSQNARVRHPSLVEASVSLSVKRE